MVNKITAITVMTIVTLSTSGAFAGQIVGSKYLGLHYAVATYSTDGLSAEPSPVALVGRLGVNVTDNLSIEGRLGLGLQDDEINIFGTNANIEIDSLIGVYGIGHINFNKNSSVYGLLGLSRAEETISAPGFNSVSDDGSGLSFGVGAEIGVGNEVSLNVEYIQYLSKSDFDLSAIAFGAKFRF